MSGNKRVGIITYHYVSNYGAVLQAYALQHYLIKTNLCEYVELINFIPKTTNNSMKKKYFNGIYNKVYKLLHLKQVFYSRRKWEKFKEFSKKYLVLSLDYYNNEKELEKVNLKYNTFITGSDQVWNTNISQNTSAYFLNFVKSGSRNSYAASFGKSELNNSEIRLCREYLPLFNCISVRENSACELLKSIGIKTKVVLDPVFLLSQNQWLNIAKYVNLKKKYIFIYVMQDIKYLDKIVDYYKKKNFAIYYCDANQTMGKIHGKCLNHLGPDEFVFVLANAEYVITDSFHGTAFSFIFNKKIISFKHDSRNTRIFDLLTKIGAQDKQISNVRIVDDFDIESHIIQCSLSPLMEEIEYSYNVINNILVENK